MSDKKQVGKKPRSSKARETGSPELVGKGVLDSPELVAKVSIMDVMNILNHMNEIMALLGSIYAIASRLIGALGGKLPLKAAPKLNVHMSFADFMNLLRGLEGMLHQIEEMLGKLNLEKQTPEK